MPRCHSLRGEGAPAVREGIRKRERRLAPGIRQHTARTLAAQLQTHRIWKGGRRGSRGGHQRRDPVGHPALSCLVGLQRTAGCRSSTRSPGGTYRSDWIGSGPTPTSHGHGVALVWASCCTAIERWPSRGSLDHPPGPAVTFETCHPDAGPSPWGFHSRKSAGPDTPASRTGTKCRSRNRSALGPADLVQKLSLLSGT